MEISGIASGIYTLILNNIILSFKDPSFPCGPRTQTKLIIIPHNFKCFRLCLFPKNLFIWLPIHRFFHGYNFLYKSGKCMLAKNSILSGSS